MHRSLLQLPAMPEKQTDAGTAGRSRTRAGDPQPDAGGFGSDPEQADVQDDLS